MDPRLTLEKRIEAELKSYDGMMCIYADDFHGNVISMGADEKVETASTIKTYILACLFEEAEKGRADTLGSITGPGPSPPTGTLGVCSAVPLIRELHQPVRREPLTADGGFSLDRTGAGYFS